jgi:hypothetical protein
MRKLTFFLAVFIVMSGFVNGQAFEGKVMYKNIVKSKIPGLSDERLNSMVGSDQEYFIKGGRYKSMTNGTMVTMQVYDNKTNRIYNKRNGSDTLFWFDASANTNTVISYEIKKNEKNILGNTCDAIIIKTPTGSTTFYYNAKYKVDGTIFKRHNYSNWAFFVGKTGALPLETVIESNQFKIESIAVDIQRLKLADSIFEIGENIPIKKSSN